MHGSTNWLYCDNCRKLFYFPPSQDKIVSKQILTGKEIDKLHTRSKIKLNKEEFGKWKCCYCNTVPLTTRIATFSYLKALDFPMFQRSWLAAEDLLRNAKRWVFIGYSLPAADYEFKYLLKRVQLARKIPPKFIIVTGKEPEKGESSATYTNYQHFFGRDITRKNSIFYDGLTDKVIQTILKG